MIHGMHCAAAYSDGQGNLIGYPIGYSYPNISTMQIC